MNKLTDFNDLHQAKGKEAVKKTIQQAMPVVAQVAAKVADIWGDPILPGGASAARY